MKSYLKQNFESTESSKPFTQITEEDNEDDELLYSQDIQILDKLNEGGLLKLPKLKLTSIGDD